MRLLLSPAQPPYHDSVFKLQLPSGCAGAATDLTQVQAPSERETVFPTSADVATKSA